MSDQWIHQQREELRALAADMSIQLDTASDLAPSWWCPRCHTQIASGSASIEQHLYNCQLRAVIPNPKAIPEINSSLFYYSNCPSVVSLLLPPTAAPRDYVADLLHEQQAATQPRADMSRVVNLADMMIEEPWQRTPVQASAASQTLTTAPLSEYAVSTQGRDVSASQTLTTLTPEQHVTQRVNQVCAGLWHERQPLATRSQFYEVLQWTARAERETSGAASVDVQALEDWLQAGQQLQSEISKKSRLERMAEERDQRRRRERYRAKNLITKKRPAQLQRDLVQLLFSQFGTERASRDRESVSDRPRARESDTHRDERRAHTDEHGRERTSERRRERDSYREGRDSRRERSREYDRDRRERDSQRRHEDTDRERDSQRRHEDTDRERDSQRRHEDRERRH